MSRGLGDVYKRQQMSAANIAVTHIFSSLSFDVDFSLISIVVLLFRLFAFICFTLLYSLAGDSSSTRMRRIDDTSSLSSAGILKISWEFLPLISRRVHTYCHTANLIL